MIDPFSYNFTKILQFLVYSFLICLFLLHLFRTFSELWEGLQRYYLIAIKSFIHKKSHHFNSPYFWTY